jgi:hypothetical protein
VECNPDGLGTDAPVNKGINNNDPCNPLLTLSHKHGCPVFSATSYVRFLTARPWIMGTICIVIGAIVAFFGRALFPWVVSSFGGFIIFTCVMLLCSLIGMLKSTEGNGNGSIALTVLAVVISLGIAGVVAYFLYNILIIGAVVLGAVGGFFIGFTTYNLAFSWSESLLALIGLCFGLALLCGYLAFVFFD